MTALASHAAVKKRQTLKVVPRPRIFPLYITHMAAHAPSSHRQCGGHRRNRYQSGLHVECLRVSVVRDGRLEKISVYGIKIGNAEVPGAEKVVELLAALQA